MKFLWVSFFMSLDFIYLIDYNYIFYFRYVSAITIKMALYLLITVPFLQFDYKFFTLYKFRPIGFLY
jgi:hypothetical protein